jgi:hypothetical protein
LVRAPEGTGVAVRALFRVIRTRRETRAAKIHIAKENPMKISTRMIAPLAATGLLAAGLGGAAALDAASASRSQPTTTAAAKTHTWKFVAIQTGAHNFGRVTFGGTDKDRSKGKFVGYDVISGKFNIRTHTVRIDFALSRQGGLMYGHVVGTEGGSYAGAVSGGTGRYKGARGTVTGHNAPQTDTKTYLTIKWTK